MKRRNVEGSSGKLRRVAKRGKLNEGSSQLNVIVNFKFLFVWFLVIALDFISEFRLELFYPLWMFISHLSETFRYKGIAYLFSYVFITLTIDMICYYLIPLHWLYLASSTYVWFQFTYSEKYITLFSILLWISLFCMEIFVRLRDVENSPFQSEICRPFAAHGVGYPILLLAISFKSYIYYRLRLNKKSIVAKENEFYYSLLKKAIYPDTSDSSKTTASNNTNNNPNGPIKKSIIYHKQSVSIASTSLTNATGVNSSASASSSANHNNNLPNSISSAKMNGTNNDGIPPNSIVSNSNDNNDRSRENQEHSKMSLRTRIKNLKFHPSIKLKPGHFLSLFWQRMNHYANVVLFYIYYFVLYLIFPCWYLSPKVLYSRLMKKRKPTKNSDQENLINGIKPVDQSTDSPANESAIDSNPENQKENENEQVTNLNDEESKSQTASDNHKKTNNSNTKIGQPGKNVSIDDSIALPPVINDELLKDVEQEKLNVLHDEVEKEGLNVSDSDVSNPSPNTPDSTPNSTTSNSRKSSKDVIGNKNNFNNKKGKSNHHNRNINPNSSEYNELLVAMIKAKDNRIWRIEMDNQKLKSDLQTVRQCESDLREQIDACKTEEKTFKNIINNYKTDLEHLQKKVQNFQSIKQQDKQTIQKLQKQLAEEKSKSKASYELQAMSEKKARVAEENAARAALMAANRTVCTENCRNKQRQYEFELANLRKELHAKNEQLKLKDSLLKDYNETKNQSNIMMTTLNMVHDNNAQLEKSLKMEQIVKMELFNALEESKRTINKQKRVCLDYEKEIRDLKTKLYIDSDPFASTLIPSTCPSLNLNGFNSPSTPSTAASNVTNNMDLVKRCFGSPPPKNTAIVSQSQSFVSTNPSPIAGPLSDHARSPVPNMNSNKNSPSSFLGSSFNSNFSIDSLTWNALGSLGSSASELLASGAVSASVANNVGVVGSGAGRGGVSSVGGGSNLSQQLQSNCLIKPPNNTVRPSINPNNNSLNLNFNNFESTTSINGGIGNNAAMNRLSSLNNNNNNNNNNNDNHFKL